MQNNIPCELHEPLERKRFDKPDAQVWVEKGTLYVTFRRERKPDIPFPTLPAHRQSPQRVSIQQMIKLDWMRNGYEYLAFIPTSIPYNNSLLLRFWLDEPNMPIMGVEVNSILTTYCLQPVWTGTWKDFEVTLLRSVDLLMLRAGVCNTICKPPRPNCRRLDDKSRSREEAVCNVYETRRRFLPWLGLFSYLVALLDGTGTFRMKTGQIEKWPVWQGTLLIHGVLPHTVKTMGDSILGSFHPSFKRVGTVIDYQSDPHALHVGMMADRNVPVIYGVPLNKIHELPMSNQEGNFFREFRATVSPSGSFEDMKKLLRKYLPPDDYIKKIRDREDARNFDARFRFLDDGFGEPCYSDTAIMDDFPPLDPLARQRKSETREEFFARQDREDRDAISRETEKMKESRLHREKVMKEFQSPGQNNKKTKVFVWQTVGRFEIRRKVTTAHVNMIWSKFAKSSMRHNALRNEWDLWTTCDPTYTHRFSDDDSNDDGDKEMDVDTPRGPDASDNLRALYIRDVLATIGTTSAKPLTRDTELGLELSRKRSLDSMLWEWFGFWKSPEHPRTPAKVQMTFEKHTWQKILQLMLYTNSEEQESDLIRLFVSFYICKELIPPHSLSEMYGVALSKVGTPNIVVARSSYMAKRSNEDKAPMEVLYSVQILDYFGEPLKDHHGRLIFVWSASIALAVKRLLFGEARSISHLADYLISRGANFVIAVPRTTLEYPSNDPRVETLGCRWRNYKPDEADFALYCERCADLLSIPRLRRALRCGGILWRIARDFLDDAEGISGPVEGTLNEPMQIVSSSMNEPELVEDSLSIDEIRILIGAFESKDADQRHQPVYYSFWPPPWVWEKSGYNIGYWSPDCEDWYTNCREQYRQGKGESLRKVQQWTGALKRFAPTQTIRNTLEKQAEAVITGNVLS